MKRLIGLLWLPAALFSGELKDSLLQAKKQDKPLMVMVTAQECRYCKKMKNETLGDATVTTNLKGFLFAQIDKTDPEAQRFLPAIHYAPTVFFVSPKWKIINSVEGYLPSADFNKWVENTRMKLGMASEEGSHDATPKRDRWMYDMASAYDYASQTGKQVMVFVGSSKSKYAKALEKNTLANANVQSALSNFVWVKINYGDKVAKNYGINPKNVPAVYFMTSDQRELAVANGYFEANDFLKWVNYAKSKI